MIKPDPDEYPIKLFATATICSIISFGLALMIVPFYVGWNTFFVAPGAGLVGFGVGFFLMGIYISIQEWRYYRFLEKERKTREANRQ